MSRCVIALAVLAAVASLAGCPSSSDDGPCTTDDDCDGLVCSRDGACLPPQDVRRVQVRWTVRGDVPSPDRCAGVAELALRFDDSSGGRSHQYGQVPCTLGLFTVDKLARRLDEVALEGLDERNEVVLTGSGSIAPGDDPTVTIDLGVPLRIAPR